MKGARSKMEDGLAGKRMGNMHHMGSRKEIRKEGAREKE